jgi:hypothetical protein
MKRLVAAGIACLGWFALGLQLYLAIAGALVRDRSVASAVLTYFSFFTIWTNLLISVCMTLVALYPTRRLFWNRPSTQTALALYIAIVAIVYAALLQNLSQPRDLQLVADRLLHVVLPASYGCYWLFFAPKGRLQLADPLWWQVYPLTYMGYTMARGAAINWYPYPFLNVTASGYKDVLWNGLLLLVLLLTFSALLIILDRLIGSLQFSREKLKPETNSRPSIKW